MRVFLIESPSERAYHYPHLVHLRGGMEETIHVGEVGQMLKPPPQHSHARWTVPCAAQKAPQLGNPLHGLLQRGWGSRGRGGVVNGTVEGLPFLQDEEHRSTAASGRSTTEHRGVHDAPGDHTEERQTALQAGGTLELARFDATATLEDFMPHLNAKPAGVPFHALLGRRGREAPAGWSAAAIPAARRPAGGYSSTTCTAQTDTAGRCSARRWPGGRSSTALKAHRQHGDTGGLVFTPGHVARVNLRHRLGQDRGPQVALLMFHTAVPRGPDQEIHARSALPHKQIVHIGFPVSHAHPVRAADTRAAPHSPPPDCP